MKTLGAHFAKRGLSQELKSTWHRGQCEITGGRAILGGKTKEAGEPQAVLDREWRKFQKQTEEVSRAPGEM